MSNIRSISISDEDAEFLDKQPRTFKLSKLVRDAIQTYKKQLDEKSATNGEAIMESEKV